VLEISSVAVTGASRIVREARVGGKSMDPTTFVVDEIGRFAFTPLQLGLGLILPVLQTTGSNPHV